MQAPRFFNSRQKVLDQHRLLKALGVNLDLDLSYLSLAYRPFGAKSLSAALIISVEIELGISLVT